MSNWGIPGLEGNEAGVSEARMQSYVATEIAGVEGGSSPEVWVGINAGCDTISDAVTTIGATKTTLKYKADQTISTNLTIPATMELVPVNQAIITVNTGVTLTMRGRFLCDSKQAFICSGTGQVVFDSPHEINVVWFTNGGRGSNADPYTGASGFGGIGEAIAGSSGPGGVGGVYILPPGRYSLTDTITITRDNVILKGLSYGWDNAEGSCVSIYQTTAGKGGFVFGDTAGDHYGFGLSGVRITNGLDNLTMLPAIKLIRCSRATFRDITIYGGAVTNTYGQGWGGIGIEVNGWELLKFERIWQYSYTPMHIKQNPYAPADETTRIDFDGCTIEDWFSHCIDPVEGAHFLFDTNIHATNITWHSHIGTSGGMYGIYWNDPEATAYCKNFHVNNFKSEYAYPTAADSWLIYINKGAGGAGSLHLADLSIHNCDSSTRNAGLAYLRNVSVVNLNANYVGGNTAKLFDVDVCRMVVSTGNIVTAATGTESAANMTCALRVTGGGAYNRQALGVWVATADGYTVTAPSIQSELDGKLSETFGVTLADGEWDGATWSRTAFEDIDAGEWVRPYNDSGTLKWALADVSTDGAAAGIAIESKTAGNALRILSYGRYRNDTAFNFSAPGVTVFRHVTTDGGMQEAVPSTTGHKVQKLGFAESADIIVVCPSPDVFEVS